MPSMRRSTTRASTGNVIQSWRVIREVLMIPLPGRDPDLFFFPRLARVEPDSEAEPLAFGFAPSGKQPEPLMFSGSWLPARW
jgi:hypothetical protein